MRRKLSGALLASAVLVFTVLAFLFWSRPAMPPGTQPGNPPGVVPGTPRSPGTPGTTPVTPPANLPPGPDLANVKSPYDLTLDQLTAGLYRLANLGEGTPGDRLEALVGRWNLRPPQGGRLVIQRDLDGDGQVEWVTALNALDPATQQAVGSLFVIYGKDGGYAVDRSESVVGAGLHEVADLLGDGGREIVWSTTDHGAHTTYSDVLVSRWSPGKFERLPGEMHINFMELRVAGKELALTGGLVGSAGAGEAQRPRTDWYRWDSGAFRLTRRQYAPSDYAYHKLIDGIVQEQTGHLTEAEPFFRQAMEPQREALKPDWVPIEWNERFGEAVHAFARFRLGAWLLAAQRPDEARAVLSAATGPYAGLSRSMLEGKDRAAGCTAAADWATSNGEFLEALNSPYGYANPHWSPQDLCGPLPPSE